MALPVVESDFIFSPGDKVRESTFFGGIAVRRDDWLWSDFGLPHVHVPKPAAIMSTVYLSHMALFWDLGFGPRLEKSRKWDHENPNLGNGIKQERQVFWAFKTIIYSDFSLIFP
jgi:hypothetical protein